MMPNCDPRDRFVDQYLKLMIHFFLAHLWVPTLDFIHMYMYLKYFAFTSAVLMSFLGVCDVALLNDNVTRRPLQPMLGRT